MNYRKFSGLFKAIVTNINDPAGYNRIQVRIPTIHGPVDIEKVYGSLNNNENQTAQEMWVKDKDLPWAEVCRSYGNDLVPEVNQVVGVQFFNDSSEYPVVMGWMGYEYTNEEDSYVSHTIEH